MTNSRKKSLLQLLHLFKIINTFLENQNYPNRWQHCFGSVRNTFQNIFCSVVGGDVTNGQPASETGEMHGTDACKSNW
jgi:hypothetical protein